VKDGTLSGIDKGKTWSEVLYEMVGQTYTGQPMVLGEGYSANITHDIGFNIKVGPKWPTKAWPEENWQELATILRGKYTFEFQQHLNNLKGYVDWVSRCRLLVTNDSLGLHIAEALGKKTVAIFGPTSFETFSRSESAIFLHSEPKLDCQPCYKSQCDRFCQCMRNVRVSDVALAIERLMNS
jgi:heptosyltransferase-2